LFDPFDAPGILRDEITQRRESGYDVDEFVAKADAVDAGDRAAVEALTDSLEQASRLPGWAYEEPGELADILAALPGAERPSRPFERDIEDKVHAGWLGRIAGCNVGKPVEWGDHWTAAHLRSYLELAGAYPLLDYVPLLDPLPAGYELREDNMFETTRGNVDVVISLV